MLIQATTINEALETVEKEMKQTMIDYSIAAITETPIMDVFLYGEKGNVEKAE